MRFGEVTTWWRAKSEVRVGKLENGKSTGSDEVMGENDKRWW